MTKAYGLDEVLLSLKTLTRVQYRVSLSGVLSLYQRMKTFRENQLEQLYRKQAFYVRLFLRTGDPNDVMK